jgi:prolyl-tRNA synthetase
MYDAYHRIFTRCGLKFFVVGASSGLMGGSGSQEFMAASPSGEDSCAVCPGCGYAANLEVARSKREVPSYPGDQLTEVATPEKRTIEEVAGFLRVPASRLFKSLLYMVEDRPVFALVRGDDELNEPKFQAAVGSGNFRPATPEEVLRITGAPVGFISPVGLDGVRVLADQSLQGGEGMVSGANREHAHYTGINLDRDVRVEKYVDLRMARQGEACPECGRPLDVTQAIELGHIFKLGAKYSQALKANFVDEDGTEKPLIMGSYGIGIERLAACIIEQSHDQSGIIWPLAVAPYQVVISQLGGPGTEAAKVSEQLYQELQDASYEVLLDDRDERPGFKFKDADLVGVPVRVNVVEKGLKKGVVEIKLRKDGQLFKVRPEEVRRKVQELTSVEMWPLKQQ